MRMMAGRPVCNRRVLWSEVQQSRSSLATNYQGMQTSKTELALHLN